MFRSRLQTHVLHDQDAAATTRGLALECVTRLTHALIFVSVRTVSVCLLRVCVCVFVWLFVSLRVCMYYNAELGIAHKFHVAADLGQDSIF